MLLFVNALFSKMVFNFHQVPQAGRISHKSALRAFYSELKSQKILKEQIGEKMDSGEAAFLNGQ